MRIFGAAVLMMGQAVNLLSAGTQTWEMTSWQDFLNGKFSGVGLTRDGQLIPAPAWKSLFNDGQSTVWSAARTPDGKIWLGTGHQGKVIRLDGKNWTLPEPQVFAIISDAKGVVYAASSPNGKIYRIEKDTLTEYFNPREKYIWSLAIGADGTLYAGTGEGGKIYAIKGPGNGEVYFDSAQSHITALAIDTKGELLAGSDPNGLLYRVSGKEKAFVIYDANFPEIRSIVPMTDGRIYVAALGGSVAKRAAAAPSANTAPAVTITAQATSITVEAQSGLDIKPKTGEATAQVSQPIPSATSLIEISGVEKSAIYRIGTNGGVEELWTSKEENVYDLIASGNRLTFSTDGPGRIYDLTEEKKITLIDQTNQGEITRLFHAGSGLLAITNQPGELRQQEAGSVAQGIYESPVHDAGSISRWGRLAWRATGNLSFQVRTGNSARPDKTWSEWSVPVTNPAAVAVPTARFVQWKAELKNGAVLDSVNLSYRPQNNPPSVKSISVVSQLAPASASSKPAAATPANAAYSITVTDTGDSGASTLSGTVTQNAGRVGIRQMILSWVTEDLDDDKLLYTLSFRGEDEQEWKTLKKDFAEATYTLDGDVFADGRYFFKVVVSDHASNPPEDARQGELVSTPVRIDNTPPQVSIVREGTDVMVKAADAASPLQRCELSIDAGPWIVLEAEDGITDGPKETFRRSVSDLPAGEHLITVRVTDVAGNPGLAKLVIR